MRMEKRTYQAPDFEMERFAMDAMEGSVETPLDENNEVNASSIGKVDE